MRAIKDRIVSADRTFLGSFGTRVGLLGIGFVTSVALARLFGAAAVGQMGLIVTLLVVTSHLSLFGAQITVLTQLPARAHEDRDNTLGPAFVVTLVLSLTLGITLSLLIKTGFLGSYSKLGAVFIPLLPIVVLANAYRVLALETLRSLSLIRIYNVVNLLIAVAILAIVVVVFLGGYRSIEMPLVIFAAEVFGMLLAGIFLAKAAELPAFNLRFKGNVLWHYLRRSSVFFLSGSSVLVGQVDLLVAGIFLPIEEVGVYAVALRLAGLASLVLVSANVSFAPEVSAIYRRAGLNDAILSARVQTRLLVPLTAVLGLFVAAVGYPLLGMFGHVFLSGYPVLLILIFAQVVGVLFGPVGIFLNMTVGQREMIAVSVVALGAGLIASFLLIPAFGIMGASLASLVALIARNLLATAFIYNRTGTGISVVHAWRGQ